MPGRLHGDGQLRHLADLGLDGRSSAGQSPAAADDAPLAPAESTAAEPVTIEGALDHLAGSPSSCAAPEPERSAQLQTQPRASQAADLIFDARALPFFEESLDLVALPHTLEFSPDPHACLREVARVLVNEGRVVISGINPMSLWGARQWRGHFWRRMGGGDLYLPVQVADMAQVLDFEGVPELRSTERQAQCLLAIGAALRSDL